MNSERQLRAKQREAKKRLNNLYRGKSLEELQKEEEAKGIVQKRIMTRLQTNTIDRIKENLNPTLSIRGIL